MCRFIVILFATMLCACNLSLENSANEKWARYGLAKCDIKTCIPKNKGEDESWWTPYTRHKLEQPHNDLLFIGDSIIDQWGNASDNLFPGGLDTWKKRYESTATNFGVYGDNTQNVLWRLTEGKALKGYAPKRIVLLIGINNLLQGDSPEDTFVGIKAVTGYLRKTLPDSKVLVLGIFPCHEKTDPIREKIRQVNEMTKKLADYKNVYFADIGNVFLGQDD